MPTPRVQTPASNRAQMPCNLFTKQSKTSNILGFHLRKPKFTNILYMYDIYICLVKLFIMYKYFINIKRFIPKNSHIHIQICNSSSFAVHKDSFLKESKHVTHNSFNLNYFVEKFSWIILYVNTKNIIQPKQGRRFSQMRPQIQFYQLF